LQGQPDYSINASIEYTNDTLGTLRMLYNRIGPKLASIGVDQLPDIIAQPRDQLDFAWLRKFEIFDQQFSGKLGVENILNDQFLEKERDFFVVRYTTGVKIGASITYNY
jgi:hypothetical protein